MVHKDQKEIKFIKRQDTEHPYCTNWPMSEQEKNIKLSGRRIAPAGNDIGWLETNLPNSAMTRLQNYIETAKKNPINRNNQLAGNISKSILLEDKDDWFFQTVLIPLTAQFLKLFPDFEKQYHIFKENAPYGLDKFWVNFQKQHEFNPPHNHSGVWSFVIWVKIPTDWREQHALPISVHSNTPKASDFEFRYTTMLGDITGSNYVLDKKSEGTLLFFPAKLQHQVYPFYNCDKERVSISGNIFIDNSETAMRQYRSQMKGKNVKKSS